MENSFYYFFSATPQVLGAILALFGLFVLTKIDNLRRELIVTAESIFEDVKNFALANEFKFNKSLTNSQIYDEIYDNLQNAVLRKNTRLIKDILNSCMMAKYELFLKYMDDYKYLESIIRRTTLASSLIAGTIILSLIVIPFGTFIIDHKFLLYYLFGLTIDCLIVSIVLLIYTLILSLKENKYSVK